LVINFQMLISQPKMMDVLSSTPPKICCISAKDNEYEYVDCRRPAFNFHVFYLSVILVKVLLVLVCCHIPSFSVVFVFP
jgi:uncharacterized Tic20 family protein